MYTPPAYAEERLEVQHAFIRAHGFATIVSPARDGGVVADHVPLVLDAGAGAYGTLIGHFARANPHVARRLPGAGSVAIFHGPHAYVTPSWYPNKHETGMDVPTWNYVAVHAHGVLETFDDPDALLAMLKTLTAHHEAGRAEPWHVEDAPDAYIRSQLRAIVGVRIPIAQIEGKFKLSQNRTARDRAGAKAGLAASEGHVARAVAALME